MEDKQKILDLFLPALQATRGLSDLKSLTYSRKSYGDEVVTAEFDSGSTVEINVSWDSGIAMISDVAKQLH